MAEEKKDSFWDNKQDDFWSKPVVTEDWLKSDNDIFWGNTDSPVLQDTENTNDSDKVLYEENPYVQHDTPEQVQNIIEGKKSRKKHVHTWICTGAILFTVLVVIALVFASKVLRKQGIAIANGFSGKEVTSGSVIPIFENEIMVLEDKAYLVAEHVEIENSHEVVNVIAVYAQIHQKENVRRDYDLKTLDPYIGYDTAYGAEYKSACHSWNFSDYGMEDTGFTEKHFLYSYANKGYDAAGFYFFLVPSDVTEIDFYTETYSYENIYRFVEKVYVNHMHIENADLEELLSRKVVR